MRVVASVKLTRCLFVVRSDALIKPYRQQAHCCRELQPENSESCWGWEKTFSRSGISFCSVCVWSCFTFCFGELCCYQPTFQPWHMIVNVRVILGVHLFSVSHLISEYSNLTWDKNKLKVIVLLLLASTEFKVCTVQNIQHVLLDKRASQRFSVDIYYSLQFL